MNDNGSMNLEDILGDIEAGVANQNLRPPSLNEFRPVGFELVTFNRDHFRGFLTGTSNLHLIRYGQPISLTAGESDVSDETLLQATARLIGCWLRVSSGNNEYHGRLLALEGKLLLFRDKLLPLAGITAIELRAVDNPMS
jgi:hypothetical protein